MAQAATTARERFLAEVSTHLDTRCQSLANECRHQAAVLKKAPNNPALTMLQCSACGSVDIHEQMVNIIEKSRKTSGCKLQLLKCQFCSKTTKRRLQTQGLEKLKTETKPKVSKTSSVASSAPEAQVTAAKSNSKKRAKERKNQGLQAMLEKSREPPQKATTSFGLLDFMSKQG